MSVCRSVYAMIAPLSLSEGVVITKCGTDASIGCCSFYSYYVCR